MPCISAQSQAASRNFGIRYMASSFLREAGSNKIPKVPMIPAISTFHRSIFPRVFFKKHSKYLMIVMYEVRNMTDCKVFFAMPLRVSTGLSQFVNHYAFLLFDNELSPKKQCR